MRLTIVQRFFALLFLILCSVLVATAIALDRPWLGLSLEPRRDGGGVVVRATDRDGPARAVLVQSRLAAISAKGERIDLLALDRIEEPDALESYEIYERFMARQGRLAGLAAAAEVELLLEAEGGAVTTVRVSPEPERPLSSLPPAYWFQLGCAVIIAIIGAWVASIRRGDPQTAMFALAGYGASLSILTAAIYSTRELALPEGLFRVLSILNHGGAMAFAAFMIGLFAIYPKRLGIPWLFPASAAFLLASWVLNILQLVPDITTGFYLPVLLAMSMITVLIGAQYVATRGDLPARRALLWLGISVLVGAGAFTVLIALPLLMGSEGLLSQSYSFGFFPLIYLGVALGLTRYRLFDLDRWAFGVLSYVMAVLLFVAIDGLLVSVLTLNFEMSLGIAAILIGLFYLPLRDWAAGRFLAVRDVEPYELFRLSSEIALQTTPGERAARWEKALTDFFAPLALERPKTSAASVPVVADEGRALDIPAYGWSGPLRLMHLNRGRRLFGTPHARMVEQFSLLVMEAERNRQAYDLGVREERSRIARDLHDNVAGMLLSSLHAREPASARDQVRGALSDIREIVHGLSQRSEALSHVVAYLRAETLERLHDIEVEWPQGEADDASLPLSYPVYRHLTSTHRELVSNVIRHGRSPSVSIRTTLQDGWLVHRLENSFEPAARDERERGGGNGLVNLKRRAAELGGSFTFERGVARAVAEVRLPLNAVSPQTAAS